MHLHEERRVYTGEPTELVCQCLKVERQKIDETIENINATTVSQVRRKCKAGGGCGSCHEEIARLILSRHFHETIDFGNQHDHEHDHEHDLAAELLPDAQIDSSLATQLKDFIDQQINPRLALISVTAKIIEIGEEVVIELINADEELKYTLSFWLEYQFAQHFSQKITTIIA